MHLPKKGGTHQTRDGSLRTTSVVNNMLAWFLGMVTFFAADMEVSLEPLLELGSASAIGGFAGWACQALNRRWAGA